MNLFDLAGRRALVTGASRGIGFALADALAGAGAALVLNGRDPASLDGAAEVLRAGGASVAVAAFDVADGAAVAEGIDRIEREVGALDILVNNAGLMRRASLEVFAEADWHRLIGANLTGVFLVAQAVARHMIPRGRGKIINIASVQSELARPGIAAYGATKGGVKMLTKGMCADWARHGLQVNGLAPGYFATDLTRALVEDEAFSAWLCTRTPAGRWGGLEDLGGAVIFLASSASDFVNGHILTVDGGLTSTV